jgi:DNA-binding transcriptional MerR regulator
MFYGEAEIGELVICPYCQNKYHDPRIIECGSSFCMPCIEFLTKTNTNGFQCPVCDKIHEQPQNGFLKNTTLTKLTEKKAKRVSRSPLANAFEAELDELKLNVDKLAKENDLGVDKIKEYCDGLRNKVQLHLEESTESLKNQSLELIQKIDAYENEAKLKFDASHNLKLNDFLNETRTFHKKWSDYLKQFEINDQDLTLASLDAKHFKIELKKESDLFLSNVFNSNVLKFAKTTPGAFGSLMSLKQSYVQALSDLKEFDLSAQVDHISSVSFKLLRNKKLCLVFRQHNVAGIKIGVWDHRNGSSLSQIGLMHIVHRGAQLVELDKAVVLCLFELSKAGARSTTSTIVKFKDGDLKILKNIRLDFAIIHADARENTLYLLGASSDRKSKSVYVCDENLSLLRKMPLGNSESIRFCVPDSVSKMRVAENYFVFLDGNKVLIMDRWYGWIKRTFSIGGGDFVLDLSNERIMAYDGETEKLACFDFEGESFEIAVSKGKKLELVDFVDERFVFYDVNSCLIYA